MTQLDLFGNGRSPFDAIRREDERGEFWTGRDLQPLMQYPRWEDFAAVIKKAKASLALIQGAEVAEHHFGIFRIDGGRWGNQRLDEYRLTRFGAYLTAMAGDDTKEAVAQARVYFAARTREAEVATEPVKQVDLTDLDDIELVTNAATRAIAIARAERARADRAEEQVAELAPKAEQADHYRAANGLTAIGDFANDLALWAKENHGVKLLHVDVRDFMAELGLLIRGKTIRNNEPTAEAQKRGLMRIKHTTYDTRTRGSQSTGSARLTQKGCGYVWDRAVRRIAEHGSLAPIASVERKSA